MIKKYKNDKGAIAIEAILGLTLFMTSVLAIMFMTLFIRVQANMQCALEQTAKEISGYYYMFDKLGLASIVSGAGSERTTESLEEVDKEISHIVSFSQQSEVLVDGFTEDVSNISLNSGMSFTEIEGMVNDASTNAENLYNAANTIASDVQHLLDDEDAAGNQIQGVLTIFAKTMINKSLSKFVAPYVCQAIMPKYLSGSKSASDEMLKSLGMENGVSGLDFSQSELLRDGRSIKLVVVYQIEMENLTFGMVKGIATFRQVASTAAWVNPQNSESLRTLAEVADWED